MSLQSFLLENNLIDYIQLMLIVNDATPEELNGYYFIITEIELLTNEKLIVVVMDKFEKTDADYKITFNINENNELVHESHIKL
jgi:hypothetical protein